MAHFAHRVNESGEERNIERRQPTRRKDSHHASVVGRIRFDHQKNDALICVSALLKIHSPMSIHALVHTVAGK